MAFAITLTTPNGGGFVFQPAEPRRRFAPNRFICIGWLATQGDQTDARTTLRPEVQKLHRSSISKPDRTTVWSVRLVTMKSVSARVGMKRLFRSGR